jgi:hypothetical protein
MTVVAVPVPASFTSGTTVTFTVTPVIERAVFGRLSAALSRPAVRGHVVPRAPAPGGRLCAVRWLAHGRGRDPVLAQWHGGASAGEHDKTAVVEQFAGCPWLSTVQQWKRRYGDGGC